VTSSPRADVIDVLAAYPEPRKAKAPDHGTDEPVVVAAAFNLPLSDPPPHATTLTVDLFALPAVRRMVAQHAERAGLSPQRTADLVLAASELTTNTVRHGGGTGELTLWADDEVVCQLTGNGCLTAPLAGRIPVPADALGGGRGLLLVNQLCDLVRVHTTSAGTTIRAYLHR
jgi:anti-sigma regulatory factor (Ser/Thr protein kinase)